MRVVLVDDEQPSLDELEYLLSKYEDIIIAGTFTKPKEALRAILQSVPDAVFLDIQMPQMDGMELAEQIHNFCGSVPVVFVTAHSRWLTEIKKTQPAEHLLKPVSGAKLEAVLEQIHQLKKERNNEYL